MNETKSFINYEQVIVKFSLEPGETAKLPLKSCINSLFLNISTKNFIFKPCTKHHFVGLVEYLPELVLDVSNKILNSTDEYELFQDYKRTYLGLYDNLVFKEGFITPTFYKNDTPYYNDLAEIWSEFYSLINTIIKHKINLNLVKTVVNSPAQIIWFNCIFSDLKNCFYTNGLLGKNTTTSKKIWAYDAIKKKINSGLDKVVEGIEPVFYPDKNKYNTHHTNCSKTYILAIAKKIAATEKNDEMLKQLTSYYKLEKRFLKKYRDNKNFQIAFLNDSGEYIRGKLGKPSW